MIAVDTSAIMAILLREPHHKACAAALGTNFKTLISAGTLAEIHVVAHGRNLQAELSEMLDRMKFDVVPVTPDISERIGRIYARWGKGFHPAALNFGDCFAYDVAKQHSCPLLFIGNDFSQTDIESVL